MTALVGRLRTPGRPVAVIAIDPSSPITGGAILGDRVRGCSHTPATRTCSSGPWRRAATPAGSRPATVAAASVLDAAGFPLIFIETVGTGQSEVEVAAIADTTIVCQAPGMGDGVRAVEAGLLEVADIVAVTKADRPGADQAAASLRAMLTVGAHHDRDLGDRPRPRRPDVLLVLAVNGEGVAELLAAVDRRASIPGAAAEHTAAALDRAEAQVVGIVVERVRARRPDAARRLLEAEVRDVAAHRLDPYLAADRMLASVLGEEP